MVISAPMLPAAAYIDDTSSLKQAVERLAAQPRIACDTESNSLHAYRGRTCLIQFSTPAEDLLIDPLAIADISALGTVFADPAVEKVFHAAEYDLICLKARLRLRCERRFRYDGGCARLRL